MPALDDRVNGMLEGLKGVNVKIVGKGETDCTEEKGINVAQDLRRRTPHLVAIYPGMRTACSGRCAGDQERQARPPCHPGWLPDFCCGEAEALAAGVEDASVAQFPSKMAELGVDALAESIRGEQVPSPIDSAPRWSPRTTWPSSSEAT